MRILKRALLRVWATYFEPAAWEVDGRIYERLGIRRASRLLLGGRYMNAAIGRLRGRSFRAIGGRRAAHEWLVFTIIVELGHGLACLVMLATAARQASAGSWNRLALTMALNLIVNAIPIMVQRYNRGRIVRAFDIDAARVLDPQLWVSVFRQDDRTLDAPRRGAGTERGGQSCAHS